MYNKNIGGFYTDREINLDESEYFQENIDTLRYRSLWRAVIMQALLDAINNSSRTEEKLAKTQSHSWLNDLSNDFLIICNMAEYNALYVKKKAVEVINKHNKKPIIFYKTKNNTRQAKNKKNTALNHNQCMHKSQNE
ncbi:hypothetical protein CAXC1_320029 [Candidatus Xenohaliotis californiensis]|uniref:Uncharacterized protein n=1 Tax=Candidatus Xenohaliotis californiensis TaxID=84677 RepID=A0ABM9N8B9_9RICK|nr:hypothetical protein CAXC1_320029 [Candidatus Xenohaliotis californiensis]